MPICSALGHFDPPPVELGLRYLLDRNLFNELIEIWVRRVGGQWLLLDFINIFCGL